jgi:hypothetical protein
MSARRKPTPQEMEDERSRLIAMDGLWRKNRHPYVSCWPQEDQDEYHKLLKLHLEFDTKFLE